MNSLENKLQKYKESKNLNRKPVKIKSDKKIEKIKLA